ncbi:ribulose-phosphate 3-epimerase [Candidatus Peregrinibacteria bacterium]|nr:ribulose-phosphate 3-epimerase [Candidatus Peregrinibacteria bacterium]
MRKIQVAPSILSADFGKLSEEIASIEAYADALHIDVMDGHFVPNLSFGYPVAKWIKSDLPKEVHLMVYHPENYYDVFAKMNPEIILIQVEAVPHLHRQIQKIKELGIKAGVVLNPATPLSSIEYVLEDLDRVLIMSVNPGFGGQKFISGVLQKIKKLREIAPDLDIEVDGGINEETAALCKEAGANIFVAGSYIFGSENRANAIASLKGE